MIVSIFNLPMDASIAVISTLAVVALAAIIVLSVFGAKIAAEARRQSLNEATALSNLDDVCSETNHFIAESSCYSSVEMAENFTASDNVNAVEDTTTTFSSV